MKKNTIIIAIVAIILIIIIVIWAQNKKGEEVTQGQAENEAVENVNNSTGTTATNSIPTDPEKTIRTKTLELGQKMKLISTTSADYNNQLQLQYGTYVTPSLLAEWKANPKLALAMDDPKMIPQRIEITSITQKGDTMYIVKGDVIVQSVDAPNPISTYSVTLTFENQRGEWLITKVVKS